MAWKIFIDGKEGTTGLKIFERFSKRNDIELLELNEKNRKDLGSRLSMIERADITFLCLPDEAAKEIVNLAPEDSKILDTSTAHRTNPQWVYGFPELNKSQRDKIKNAKRVSVPGCHATGFISIVNPFIEMDIVKKDYPFSCHSITGYSGGGKKMIAEYENEKRPEELKSPRQYGLDQKHKHLKEMTEIPKLDFSPIFNPIVGNFYRGIAVSVPFHNRLLSQKNTAKNIYEKVRDYYKNQPMIRVMDFEIEPEKGFLGANNLEGENHMEIYVFGHDEQTVLTARFDNLGKGASGAAVQCMNIMLNLPEDTGL